MSEQTKQLLLPAISYLIKDKVTLELPSTLIVFPYEVGQCVERSNIVVNNKQQLLEFLEHLVDRLTNSSDDIYLCHELGMLLRPSIQSMMSAACPYYNTLNNVLGELLVVNSFYSLTRKETNEIRAQIVRGIIKAIKKTPYIK